VVSFTSRPMYPQGKSPWYTLDRRLGGPQNSTPKYLNLSLIWRLALRYFEVGGLFV